MFNDFFFFQLLILLALFFIACVSDFLFLLLNSVLFLLLVGLYLWFLELDVYVNFLLVIDLGVFFVLISLLINFISLFQTPLTVQTYNVTPGLCCLFLLLFYFSGIIKSTTPQFLVLTLYDWNNLFLLSYFSDLQFLADIYYVFNAFEFIVMNFYLYAVIFMVYFFFYALKSLTQLENLNRAEVFYWNSSYMKTQNFHKQSNQTSTVRVFRRKERHIKT